MIEIYEENNQKEHLILENLNLEVTEKCSLRCKDCSMLMPYRIEHTEYDTKQMLETLRKVSKCVDSIGCLHILGGGTFACV